MSRSRELEPVILQVFRKEGLGLALFLSKQGLSTELGTVMEPVIHICQLQKLHCPDGDDSS